MDVCGTPRVVVVAPWIRTRLDRREAIATSLSVSTPAETREVRVEWSRPSVGRMPIASGGVRLPDLDERVGHGASVTVEHATAHDDVLPEGFSVLADRQVVVRRRTRSAPEPADLSPR
jgi:hypothetical protein